MCTYYVCYYIVYKGYLFTTNHKFTKGSLHILLSQKIATHTPNFFASWKACYPVPVAIIIVNLFSIFFQLSLEQLAKLGVQCLKPDYIAEYLSKGEVQAEAFYINDVKPFLTKYR